MGPDHLFASPASETEPENAVRLRTVSEAMELPNAPFRQGPPARPPNFGGRFPSLRRELLVRGQDARGLPPARNPQRACRFLQIAIDREGREPEREGDFLGRHAARDEPQAIAFARSELIDRPGHHRCQLLAIARANPTELVRFSGVSFVKGE